MDSVTAHGACMPALGFGTWDIRGPAGRDIILQALEIGYRHLDTAAAYENEAEVGAALKMFGRREQVWLTTKVWPTEYEPAAFRASVERSLERLGVAQVDLLLAHWPNPKRPLGDPIEGLNWAAEQGYTRHIGVSNFTSRLLDETIALGGRPLFANQIEYHPFLNQRIVLQACRRHGIAATAYCPVARGRVVGDPVIERIARAHGKTAGQVALRWLIQQQGVAAIPRTANPVRVKENFEVFDFTLSTDDMAAIHGLADPDGRVVPDGEIRAATGLQTEDGHGAAPFVPAWDPVI